MFLCSSSSNHILLHSYFSKPEVIQVRFEPLEFPGFIKGAKGPEKKNHNSRETNKHKIFKECRCFIAKDKRERESAI